MKLILSRKGFDSASGGIPSPVLPEGFLCSLPIPSDERPRLREVFWQGRSLSEIVNEVAYGRISPECGVHLDPDLREDARPRPPSWIPSFGQAGAAQAHLENRGVGSGDLFLFFGWFRRTVHVNGQLAFDRTARDRHVLFGWLQVGRVLRPTGRRASIPSWAAEHPHVQSADRLPANNTLYVAREFLDLPGLATRLPGAGIFPNATPRLTLSVDERSRSVWRLPGWFFPGRGRPPLSYHEDARRWQIAGADCYLQTVGRGQEFVLDCDHYPESVGWLRDIFETLAAPQGKMTRNDCRTSTNIHMGEPTTHRIGSRRKPAPKSPMR
jgi:hypothetical protein